MKYDPINRKPYIYDEERPKKKRVLMKYFLVNEPEKFSFSNFVVVVYSR